MSKVYRRKAIFEELSDWCHCSDAHDYIEITEWHNGEGFDVSVSSKQGSQQFQLTWGEFELLESLVGVIK